MTELQPGIAVTGGCCKQVWQSIELQLGVVVTGGCCIDTTELQPGVAELVLDV